MTRAGFQRGLLKGWTVSRPTLSNAYAIGLVFRTADGAHAGLKVFSQGLKPMKDLGEEAFGFVHDNDGANYLWRLGNLVIGADIDCPDGSCSFDVARATRIYAGVIDNQARKVRKR